MTSRAIRVLGFPAFANRGSNPYNADFYGAVGQHDVHVSEFTFRRALFGRYDIVHVHWPEKFLNSHYAVKAFLFSALLLLSLKRCRERGGQVVWTVHNVNPHATAHPWCYRMFWPRFLRGVDATISLSHENQRILLNTTALPSAAKHTVIYHPLYAAIPVDSRDLNGWHSRVTGGRPYCLFFGRILPYKNVEALIALFQEDPPDGVDLVIAGQCETTDYEARLAKQVANGERVHFISRRTTDEELAVLIKGCRLGVLPFQSIFNSGSVMQFPTYQKPVMTPYSNNFAEYGECFETSPFVLYEGELTRDAVTHALANPPHVQAEPPECLTWLEAGRRAADFFRDVTKIDPLS